LKKVSTTLTQRAAPQTLLKHDSTIAGTIATFNASSKKKRRKLVAAANVMIDFDYSISSSQFNFESFTNNTLLLEMPSVESSINKLNQPKHLCIRLATGPQYCS
jgi:hypothetical protein